MSHTLPPNAHNNARQSDKKKSALGLHIENKKKTYNTAAFIALLFHHYSPQFLPSFAEFGF